MYKVTEMFLSLQGEGFHVGVPSVFIRFFGCPFTCPGFGVPKAALGKGGLRYYHEDPNLIALKSLDEFPVPTTGCDSSAAWAKNLEHLSKDYDPYDLTAAALALMPANNADDCHIVLTGGEPLIPKWQKQHVAFLTHLSNASAFCRHVTIETNGFYRLKDELAASLASDCAVTFSISPKLSNSGEPWSRAIRPDSVKSYMDTDVFQAYFKFVVRDKGCIEEVKRAIDAYRKVGVELPVYLMPEGAVQEQLALTARDVAEVCLQEGWRYSPRLHVDLFGNGWGT